jgi:glucan 1,3-beta-glucosidase
LAAPAAEIEAGLAAAGRAPAAVRALVVGNEVLLRREQTPEALEDLVRQVAARSPVPVTYADVWEFWHPNEGLADTVDFVTVHILPYWEDEPRGIADAVAHVRDTHALMSTHFSDKPVIIGETGWPDAGRQRGPAEPGHRAQAAFTRQWIAAAAESGIDYNLIEAFDQPWKRAHEGAMGGAWGVLTPEAEPKFPLTGPIAEAPLLGRLMLGGAVVGLSLGLLLTQSARRAGLERTGRWRRGAAPALLGSLGALLPWQWETVVVWARTPLEWAAMGGFALLGLAFVWWVVRALCAPERAFAGRTRESHLLFRSLAGACLLSLAYVLVLHALDDRYRGFPLSLFLAPAAALIAARAAWPGLAALPDHARWLPILIGACAGLMAWRGWPDNAQALGFSALALAMAAASAAPSRRRHELNTQTPPRTAATPGSGP